MKRALWTLGLAAMHRSVTRPVGFGHESEQPPSLSTNVDRNNRAEYRFRAFLLFHRFFALLLALMFVGVGASAANAQSLSLVTSQQALQSNDNISWAQLSSSNGGSELSSSFNVTSANGNPISVSLTGANSILAVSCPASSCSWVGSGMPSADTLVWTSDGTNGGNGPLTASFGHPQAGVGAFIQADGPSQFTAQIQAFNSAGAGLGTFTETSDATGDALFIGVLDRSGAQISTVVFSLVSAQGPVSDFAIDSLFLSGPVLPTPTASVTPTITPTRTPTATPTPNVTPTPTQAGTPTPTPAPSKSATPTATLTPTKTATATLTPTRTPTATPTLTATLTVTPTVVPTIPPPTLPPTATATLTVTATPTETATPTPTATPTSSIAFVGAGPLTDYSTAVTTVTLGLPADVQAGDTLLAQIIVYDGNGSDVPNPPSGWTTIRHDSINNGLQATSWLFYKTASANEPFSYGWNISSNWAAGAMGAWRGASPAPIDGASGTTAAGALQITASAPSLTPNHNNELQVYFYGSQSSVGPTITPSSSVNQRFDSTSSKEGFALAFADLAAPFANNPSITYPAVASISGTAVVTAQAVLLMPASLGASPTPTVPATKTATSTPIPTTTPTRTPIPTNTITVVPTPTTTATLTSTPVATPTPAPVANITFVATGPLADYSTAVTTVTVGLPSGVQAGDTLIAQILVYDGSASDVPTAPNGWNFIRHDSVNNGNKATSWLYYKTASSNEPASYGWNISSNWAAGVMAAWRGASASPIDTDAGAIAFSGNPVSVSAPSLTPSTNNERQVYFYGSQSSAAPAIALSGAQTQRFDAKSSKEGFSLAVADAAAPSTGNPSATYPATASGAGGAAMTGQDILLIPGAQNATPTPTKVPTITSTPTAIPTNTATVASTPVPTTTATPTAVATPANITFVGTGPLTDYSTAVTTVSVGAPSGVQSGDVLLAQIVIYNGNGTDVPSAPGGWTNIRHDSVNDGNQITSWLYYKVAGANEPSSYGWNIASNWAAGVMGAWRGAAAAPVGNSGGLAVAGASPLSGSAPSLTPSNDSEMQVYFYGAQSHAGPALTVADVTQRFEATSSKEGFALAFADLVAPSAGNPSPTYPATATMSGGVAMTAQAVLLTPASGIGSSKTRKSITDAPPSTVIRLRAARVSFSRDQFSGTRNLGGREVPPICKRCGLRYESASVQVAMQESQGSVRKRDGRDAQVRKGQRL